MKKTILLILVGVVGVWFYYRKVKKSPEQLAIEGQKADYNRMINENRIIGQVAQNQNLNAIPPLMDIAALTSGFLANLSNMSGGMGRDGKLRTPYNNNNPYPSDYDISNYGATDWSFNGIRNQIP